MFALTLLTLVGCESDREREERIWTETFGAVVAQYQGREGAPEMDPSEVQGRKILVDAFFSSATKREGWEALTPEDIGLVIVDTTVNDDFPVASYSGGMKGYAGDVTMRAWAHPDGKLVAVQRDRCTPSSVAYDMGGVEVGNMCGGTREQRARWGGELTGATDVMGSNTDWMGTRAYEALALPYQDKLADPVADAPPSVGGRKVLVMVKGPKAWEVAQSRYGADEDRLADGAQEVGVVVMQTIEWEAKASHRFAGGQRSYAGEGALVAVAHPEGVVVARAAVPCEHDDQRLVDALPGYKTVYHCDVPRDIRAAFVNDLP